MNIVQKAVKDKLREVCREMDLPFNVVHDIYLSEFRFVRDEILKGEKNNSASFKNILLKYFGTFKISPGKIAHMKRNSEAKEDLDA